MDITEQEPQIVQVKNSSQKTIEKRLPRSPREKRFIREYIKTGSVTKAAMHAYENATYESARTMGSRILKKIDIYTVLEKHGITDKLVTQTLKDAMMASDADSLPLWDVRLKAIEIVNKLKGHYKQTVTQELQAGPVPLLGGATVINVQNNYGIAKDPEDEKKNQVRERGDLVKQDNINHDVADRLLPDAQGENR